MLRNLIDWWRRQWLVLRDLRVPAVSPTWLGESRYDRGGDRP